ncbi:immunogenic protein P37 (plasmid) [Borrelia sp. A-FGy1]|uniref:immunogenic protein P37 n=1 Tax=Borrelia sp. A-FGy1 TaxID=2608247 RepID=UPI0015F5C8BF|nr:immunogenic protein P37 [Borrelia sp. A-FGy1]QMU99869.1 immunogenic protein P37 [Borrelia sp. A-FGy1]
MNLMIKVLLISSLFSSFISCKLYEKLTDKSQQALDKDKAFVYDKDIADNKNINSSFKLDNSSINSIKDTNRSGRTPRSADDDEEIGVKENNQNRNDQQQNNESKQKESEKNNSSGIQADSSVGIAHSAASEVDNKKHDTSRQPQLFNKDSSEAKEARKIMHEASNSLKEAEKINAALEKTRSKLDKIKRLAGTANSYLDTARKNGSRTNKPSQELLHKLHQAINKTKSSHASLNSFYNDAIAALALAKASFEHAKRKANDALEEALKDIPHLGSNYLYHYRINDANDAMESAKSLLEVAKNKQKELNENMTKTNKDFQELNDIYKKLQDVDSR